MANQERPKKSNDLESLISFEFGSQEWRDKLDELLKTRQISKEAHDYWISKANSEQKYIKK